MTPCADPERNVIYLTTGNPWPDYASDVRPGDNLYTDSIVALDAATGKLKWYFQEVPHDLWDWDAASPPVLFDTFDSSGGRVAAIGEAGKTGWFYVLDRDTGKLVRRSQNFVPQSNMFVEPTRRGVDVLPGPGGGSNWSPVSMNQRDGIVVVTAISSNATIYGDERSRSSTDDSLGSYVEHHHGTQYGLASGIDVNDGHLVWQDRFSDPMIGGSASSSGGITVFGESNGNVDAVATTTGILLWRFRTGAGVNAPPVIYKSGGHEYIAIASGGNERVHSRLGDSIFVFSLPRTWSE